MSTSYKEVYKYNEVRPKYLSALDKLAKPIINTLTPKGRNVVIQDEKGNILVTNDGVTIAKNIWVEDEVENIIISAVKQSALRTNAMAGDGTSTTILLADSLIRGGMALIDSPQLPFWKKILCFTQESGMNQMDLSRDLQIASKAILDEIDTRKIEVDGSRDLEYIARISSNNDSDIAKNVVDVVEHVGVDGMVFLEDMSHDGVEVEKESGFLLEVGYSYPQFVNVRERMTARYGDVVVFMTDKRLYYEDEVLAIFNTLAEMGERKVVIVAPDFIGPVPNLLMANHTDPKVPMEILPLKVPDKVAMEDLAVYLGGRIVREDRGSFAQTITEGDFVRAEKVHTDSQKSIILSSNKESEELKDLISFIRSEIKRVDKDSKEEKGLQKRLGSLTNGVASIKVGGKTPAEIRERLFRYEDAINATRNALKDGYVVGGGLTLKNVYEAVEEEIPASIREVVKAYCESPIRQIAINCGLEPEYSVFYSTDVHGYNAATGNYEDLLDAGIIEPVSALKMAVENSFSVAQVLLSSEYIIINKENKE